MAPHPSSLVSQAEVDRLCRLAAECIVNSKPDIPVSNVTFMAFGGIPSGIRFTVSKNQKLKARALYCRMVILALHLNERIAPAYYLTQLNVLGQRIQEVGNQTLRQIDYPTFIGEGGLRYPSLRTLPMKEDQLHVTLESLLGSQAGGMQERTLITSLQSDAHDVEDVEDADLKSLETPATSKGN